MHPFFGNGPFELGVGGFIGRKEIVPDDGRVRGVDDLERALFLMLQPDDRDPSGLNPVGQISSDCVARIAQANVEL
jgi:hypothetical protein